MSANCLTQRLVVSLNETLRAPNVLCRLVNNRHGLHEDDARWLFQQLMLAVDYMHRLAAAAATCLFTQVSH